MKCQKTLYVLFFVVSVPAWSFPGDIVFDPTVAEAVSSMDLATNANIVLELGHLIEHGKYLKQELDRLQSEDYK